MGSRFVRPETVTLPISDGDWILVKRRLTVGESREYWARAYRRDRQTGELLVNRRQAGPALVTAYLIDWSLTDDEGKPVLIRGVSAADMRRVLDGLDVDSFTEIRDAIQAHKDAMEKEREEEKKTRRSKMNGAAISPSPSASDGAWAGSASSTPTTTAPSYSS
jgi:hypothetical protein